ncbi:TIGR02117 family protein [Sphingomonas sp. HF-S4]|uniref:TIGR02117 family protein n=1 Tax=Sphingomonas agrestis TaxID=3080540 RepID=A0ABU3YCG3_9SPHN|nr:TIGR02117 family protein [Sphingomonas sp. HF-S4]MDV3458972.1 TIGR02117 family protein [Sphingomonas sp. HF-S4]
MRALLGLGAVLLCYGVAALVGSAILVNRGWTPPAQGVTIYVADNGIHTDLVLPARDFADLVRAEHFADPRQAAQPMRMFGWGDRDFYLNTPRWRDVNPIRVLGALAGAGKTVLHVTASPVPEAGPKLRALRLRPQEYARLVAYVRATFAGAPVRGYGAHDAFYAARGGYSALGTCNEWSAGGLRAAGVRMGAWTPFAFGVMRWL